MSGGIFISKIKAPTEYTAYYSTEFTVVKSQMNIKLTLKIFRMKSRSSLYIHNRADHSSSTLTQP
jgi:hypothetical protein